MLIEKSDILSGKLIRKEGLIESTMQGSKSNHYCQQYHNYVSPLSVIFVANLTLHLNSLFHILV